MQKIISSPSSSIKQKISAYIPLTDILSTKDFNESVRIGDEGIKLATQIGDSDAIGQIKAGIGSAEYFMGHYDKAATLFYSSIEILEHTDNKRALALTLNNLAKLYRKTRELDKADHYYSRAMGYYNELHDSLGIQMIWNEWGVVYEYRGKYQKAAEYYNNSLAFATARKDYQGIAYSYNNLAGLAVLEEKFSDAENYMNKCLQIREQQKDTFGLAMTYNDIGNMYAAAGKYEEAKQSLLTSAGIAGNMNFRELLSTNYRQLAELFEKTQNYKQAYNYFLQATQIHDSIYGIEKTKQIAELNTRYETEKKEQLILLQKTELSRKNYLIASIIAILLLGVLFLYSSYRRYKLKQEARLQSEILNQQKLAASAVIEAEEKERERIGQDLHDGVGQLMSAVKINLSVFQHDFILNNEDERIKFDNIIGLVDESCKEVRAVSHTMMPNALLKAGLASAVRDFVQKIDNKALEVNLYAEGLDTRIDNNTETILYRVIQECVNNVIKHAKASRLHISLIKDADGINVTIEDNGIGFNTADTNTFDGIGLKNMRTRIAYLSGSIDFDSRPGQGTVVMIQIPNLAT